MAPIIPTGYLLLPDAVQRVRQVRFPDVKAPSAAATFAGGASGALAASMHRLAASFSGQPDPWEQATKDSQREVLQALVDGKLTALSQPSVEHPTSMWFKTANHEAVSTGRIGHSLALIEETALEKWLNPVIADAPKRRPPSRAAAQQWLVQHQQAGLKASGVPPVEEEMRAANKLEAGGPGIGDTMLRSLLKELDPLLKRERGEDATRYAARAQRAKSGG